MCRVDEFRRAVPAENHLRAGEPRAEPAGRGLVAVHLSSSPGSGKTALLEAELWLARTRGVPVAAVTADLATENDAARLARAGVPVKQIRTDGRCHPDPTLLRRHLTDWLPKDTRLLFVENVGNLVCPASYDLGGDLRVVLVSVTEGEDKPLKYPAMFGLANLVVVTKLDLAEAAEFDHIAFLANIRQVNPGVEVLFSSARTGVGIGGLLDRALAVPAGTPAHVPGMTRQAREAGQRDYHRDSDPARPHPDSPALADEAS
jgi:hydrogenase nickel incorporation protein HypB